MTQTSETRFDRTLRFSLPGDDARGRVVRLGPVLNTILSAHAYPPAAERVLAQALVLTALLGSLLKDDGSQLTMQAQTENGPISLLVCDYIGGELRGYLAFDMDRLAEAGADPSLFALFGKGYLALTFDHGESHQRYQGIVPLEGHSLADALQNYFRQSEQLPTFARVAVTHVDGVGCVAAGMLVQQLAAGEVGEQRIEARQDDADAEARWAHLEALAETTSDAELTDADLSLEALVWRLYHDESEVRVSQDALLSRGCRCDADHLARVLTRFSAEERAEMTGPDGMIGVDCAFCSRIFPIDPAALDAA